MTRAHEIVLKDLRSCYTKDGMIASHVNFSDYWARDSFWACLGMLEVKDSSGNISQKEVQQVRRILDLFIKYQREDGKIPRKICLDFSAFKYLGLKIKRKTPRPIYTSPIKSFFAFDANLLFVIAFVRYFEVTGDEEYAKKYFESVKKSLEFYSQNNLVRDLLLYEKGLGNWMDTIFKKGFVLYTNCLWYRAVESFESLAIATYQNMEADFPASEKILEKIKEKFWLEDGYYADLITKKGKQQKYFDLAGNLITLLFGIADQGQSEKIFNQIKRLKGSEDKLHAINSPKYPFWKINPIVWLFGLWNYHNQNSWSWLEALITAAYVKFGRIDEARENLENFAKIVVKNNSIHETYFLDGKPFDHRFWKSAVPFAWGAGLYLYAEALVDEY